MLPGHADADSIENDPLSVFLTGKKYGGGALGSEDAKIRKSLTQTIIPLPPYDIFFNKSQLVRRTRKKKAAKGEKLFGPEQQH